MAYRDYILCEDCEEKIVYDGDDNGRTRMEDYWGDPSADTWTAHIVCPACLKALRTKLAAAEAERDARKERERVLREAIDTVLEWSDFEMSVCPACNHSDPVAGSDYTIHLREALRNGGSDG